MTSVEMSLYNIIFTLTTNKRCELIIDQLHWWQVALCVKAMHRVLCLPGDTPLCTYLLGLLLYWMRTLG